MAYQRRGSPNPTEVPKFKLTDPSDFILWVVGRINDISDRQIEASNAQTAVLVEIRDELRKLNAPPDAEVPG